MAYTRSVGSYAYVSFYRHLIISVGIAAMSMFLTLALITYNPYDSSWFYATSSTQPVTNWAGVSGAHLAALLFYLFGASSLWLLMGCGIILRSLWRQEAWSSAWDRVLASVLGMCASAALSYGTAVDFLQSPSSGGLLGYSLYSNLVRLFDPFGAIICLSVLLVIAVGIVLRVYLIRGIRALYKAFVRWGGLRRCFAVSYWLSGWCLQQSMRPCRWVWHSLRTVFGHLILSYHDQDTIDYGMLVGEQAPHDAMRDDAFWHQLQSPHTTVPKVEVQHVVPQNVVHVQEGAISEQGASYQVPDVATLFTYTSDQANDATVTRELKERAKVLEEKLACFGSSGKVVAIKRGPVVTLFEYKPDIDAKISKIVALEDDLALALQALSIRIIAPIPGTSVVGFEVANDTRHNVHYAQVVQSEVYTNTQMALPLVLGKNTQGADVVVDLAKMPHLLIAGSTGSGKSVALNAMLISLLCKRSPDELQLILIDPKRLEFTAYADIGHLVFPIVTNPSHAIAVLHWVVKEMEERYQHIAAAGARHVIDYNKMVPQADRKPYLVVIIDELADLMMTAGRELEGLITRIAQMARAAGIHMMVATQRPSVDVITGLIKVNFPSRISFRVTSKVDSRTILDCAGADKLLGRGDMLFLDSSDAHLKRVHGAYVSDKEIAAVIAHIRAQRPAQYKQHPQNLPVSSLVGDQIDDTLYQQVVDFLREIDEVSISLLQRRFRIGYNRSARIIELLESRGVIMPSEGGKTRKVIR